MSGKRLTNKDLVIIDQSLELVRKTSVDEKGIVVAPDKLSVVPAILVALEVAYYALGAAYYAYKVYKATRSELMKPLTTKELSGIKKDLAAEKLKFSDLVAARDLIFKDIK